MTETQVRQVRAMSADDIPDLQALSVEAGWPHRAEDWRFLVGLGRGFVVTGGTGRIGGCAAWWPFGPAWATVGMVIVSPSLQGRGIGGRLMARIFDEAGPRSLRLHATEAGRRLYELAGFAAAGTLWQHQGIAWPAGTPTASPSPVRPLRPADRAAILALDTAATAMDREALVDALWSEGQGSVHETGGRVTGYAFTRAFGRGRVLGPLIAEDDAAANALLDAAVADSAGTFLRADTPLAPGSFRARVAASGLPEVSTALAMVRGQGRAPSGAARVYCVAAQAIG